MAIIIIIIKQSLYRMKNFSIYKYKRVRNAKLLSLFVLYFD